MVNVPSSTRMTLLTIQINLPTEKSRNFKLDVQTKKMVVNGVIVYDT